MSKAINRIELLKSIIKKEFRSAPEAWICRDKLLEIVENVYKAELARRTDYGGRIG